MFCFCWCLNYLYKFVVKRVLFSSCNMFPGCACVHHARQSGVYFVDANKETMVLRSTCIHDFSVCPYKCAQVTV